MTVAPTTHDTVDTETDRAVLLFSGGFDSTLVLADMCDCARTGSTIYAVTIDHNITGTQKLRREYESQLLILRALRQRYPNITIHHEIIKVESNWTVGDSMNCRGLSQPIFWVCNILPFLEDNDYLHIAYNKDDQAILHEQDIRNMFDAALRIQGDKKVELHFPLKYRTKVEVIERLLGCYSDIAQYCVSCEADFYNRGKLCGECIPCKHLKQALLNISLNNELLRESVNEWLANLFGIIFDIRKVDDCVNTVLISEEEICDDESRKQTNT